MNTLIRSLMLWCTLVCAVPALALEEPCDCPKLGCDPCSVEKGVTFYTSKCGPQGSRLKSCARPTCALIEQATKECPVVPRAGDGPREPVVVQAATSATADPNADTHIIGQVKVISGSVSIVNAQGMKTVITGEGKLRETDTVESASNGTAVVHFDGGNRLHVHPDTAVQVREYKDQADPDSRKALLQLIKGKIRTQVEQKYNGKTSQFKVYTTGAVAGVRGTDFVMEHYQRKGLETRIETLSGKVTLSSLDEKDARTIQRGEGASFTAALPDADFKGNDLSEFIRHGKLSPIYKLSAEELRTLEQDSRVDVPHARPGAEGAGAGASAGAMVASGAVSGGEICDKPKGRFNQCAWTCAGNPANEKICRGDLAITACIRTRCDANGKWSDPTKLSAKAATSLCPATGVTVRACDY